MMTLSLDDIAGLIEIPGLSDIDRIIEANTEAERKRIKYNFRETLFPDHGPLAHHMYKKHMDFFAAGAFFDERLFLAANRAGKSFSGLYEDMCHVTGQYPWWWVGRRFCRPVRWWVVGPKHTKTRDVLQRWLIGQLNDWGTGFIPKDNIVPTTSGRPGTLKSGVPGGLDMVLVRHYTDGKYDGDSCLWFKSFQEGVLAFEADEIDGAHVDEECPAEIWNSISMRTMTNNGIIFGTETPLMGMTELLVNLHESTEVHIVTATWDDAPHLTDEQKRKQWAKLPPHQRDARAKGIPKLGAGAVYPVDVERVFIEPFSIPKHWKRAFALDVGWGNTAAIFGHYDEENDIIYLTGEYKMQEQPPPVHASAIKHRGYMPGCIDPASRGRGQADGQKLFEKYVREGLDLKKANNAVEAGIYEVWERMQEGRLFIFNTLKLTYSEFILYRRVLKSNGRTEIHKENDHLMDCMRYLINSGLDWWVPAGDKPGDRRTSAAESLERVSRALSTSV